MPTEREHGKRYCHGCGVKKRTASFDAVDGKLSERCRGCMGTESARRAYRRHEGNTPPLTLAEAAHIAGITGGPRNAAKKAYGA